MKRKIIVTIILIIACYLFLHINNKWLQTTFYTVKSERIPQAFDGLTIVQLSDLHDATFGEQQLTLVNKVKKLNPDLIFITGDLIDSNRYDLENSLQLVKQLVTMTDVYYVTGNHEVAVNEVEKIKHELTMLGVHVLTNETNRLTRNGEEIVIAGIDDPLMKNQLSPDIVVDEMLDQALTKAPRGEYTILLSHRPEVFDVYIDKQLDLVFTGHAHGGQLRLPGFGGLIAPGQGWFPSYTSGKHQRGITEMIVNRGLGNSIFPYRIFNRPEIVVVTLRHPQ
ncbi:metallophosphoesterase [Bacillus sp. FJAT-50079]|uniref:metallophosphoesterase n=1 Tax=Bacillus sp. FJAT-50079 TaxID=2833577 RepID=UPI001BC9C6AB|nr:metallophosphoesterase [Bacillus sp. FJAT-50079]MBS4206495.1 metallophosphoesterase [Bacillus sp. FJAT-50079]